MPAPEFQAFLERSFQVLRAQVPSAYERVAERLAPCPLRIEVNGDSFVLRFRDENHSLEPRGPSAGELRTSRAAILALIDGDLDLLGALTSDRLFLRGPVEVVERFDGALQAFLAGAVRAPDFPALLAHYRSLPSPQDLSAKEIAP